MAKKMSHLSSPSSVPERNMHVMNSFVMVDCLAFVSGRTSRTNRKASTSIPASKKKVPLIPKSETRRIGVSMATTKLPSQLAEVVMETDTPRTFSGNISLVTTHATGLYTSILTHIHHMLLSLTPNHKQSCRQTSK